MSVFESGEKKIAIIEIESGSYGFEYVLFKVNETSKRSNRPTEDGKLGVPVNCGWQMPLLTIPKIMIISKFILFIEVVL